MRRHSTVKLYTGSGSVFYLVQKVMGSFSKDVILELRSQGIKRNYSGNMRKEDDSRKRD